MRRSVPFAACFAFLTLTTTGACAPARAVQRTSGQLGHQLELAAPDLSGRETDVGAMAGKVRVVDFWASWCEPCREALPHLDAMGRELGARGLEVVAVSFDEDQEQIASFLAKAPVGFPVLWDKGGDRYSARYEVNQLPTTLVVDRKGVIRLVQEGYSAAKERETRRAVEKLLDEAP
jgi:thiol-disulfide isomerase/thioredoxin